MAHHLKPERVRIINEPAKYPVTYDTGVATTATQFTMQGFGTTKLAQVKNMQLIRGLSPQKPQYNVTAATAGEITVGSPIPANTKVFFQFEVETTNRELEAANNSGYEFNRIQEYEVVLQTGDGADEVLRKLYDALNAGARRRRDFFIKGDVAAGGTLAATTLDDLDIEVQKEGYYIKSFKALGEDGEPSAYVTTFAPVVSVEFTKGRGYGSDVEFRRKLQQYNNQAYHFDFAEIPQEGQLYSMIAWEFDINRPDPNAESLSNRNRRVLYINEATGETMIDSFADFFLTTPATRATALDADGITVGFNDSTALTNANTASSATNLDSDHATLTPILGTLAGTDPKYLEAESVAIDDTLDDFLVPVFKANA